MDNLTDERLRAVLDKLGKGPGGMACTIEKDARVAIRAEVAFEKGKIRLKRSPSWVITARSSIL